MPWDVILWFQSHYYLVSIWLFRLFFAAKTRTRTRLHPLFFIVGVTLPATSRHDVAEADADSEGPNNNLDPCVEAVEFEQPPTATQAEAASHEVKNTPKTQREEKKKSPTPATDEGSLASSQGGGFYEDF
jgi:hypothetical protein